MDALLGEPEQIWKRVRHPVRIMGDLVGWADKKFNSGGHRKAKGAALMAAGVLASLASGALVSAVPDFGLLEVLLAATLLCQKSLVEHVRTVADGLRYGLQEGRNAVGKIVGRDVRSWMATALHERRSRARRRISRTASLLRHSGSPFWACPESWRTNSSIRRTA